MQSDVCCPQFDPAPWDGKILEWKGKKFIRGRVRTLLFMPLNYGSVMGKLTAQAESAGASIPDGPALSDHVSGWSMHVYLAVDREIPGADNTTLSGKFFSRVYEGPFKDTGAWCKDFEAVVAEKRLDIEKRYEWYTTCPKCAKKYGKNYVVLLGKLK